MSSKQTGHKKYFGLVALKRALCGGTYRPLCIHSVGRIPYSDVTPAHVHKHFKPVHVHKHFEVYTNGDPKHFTV